MTYDQREDLHQAEQQRCASATNIHGAIGGGAAMGQAQATSGYMQQVGRSASNPLMGGAQVGGRQWDAKAEAELDALEAKCIELRFLQRAAVTKARDVLHGIIDGSGDAVRDLIDSAEEVRDALAPFDSGCRQGRVG